MIMTARRGAGPLSCNMSNMSKLAQLRARAVNSPAATISSDFVSTSPAAAPTPEPPRRRLFSASSSLIRSCSCALSLSSALSLSKAHSRAAASSSLVITPLFVTPGVAGVDARDKSHRTTRCGNNGGAWGFRAKKNESADGPGAKHGRLRAGSICRVSAGSIWKK